MGSYITLRIIEISIASNIKYGINILSNVKYLPISTVDIQWLNLFFFLVGMRVVLNVFLVIQNTAFFLQISKKSVL